MKKHGSLLFKSLILGVILIWTSPVILNATTREFQVKAAFIYNFARLVKWPKGTFIDPDAPMSFCVFGKDPFGPLLDALAKETIRGRQITVKRVKDIKETSCHVLYISKSVEEERIEQVFRELPPFGVLTIGERHSFGPLGGHIHFMMEANKVRFHVNLYAAEKDGFKISSKLLRIARVVNTEPFEKK